ncbi:MAG: L-idonate 5-dehydrogenase [Phaeobacter gallaeciensis]
MRAVVIHAAQDLRIEEHSEVPAPGGGEVCINMAVGGICGSDLHYYSHGGFGAVRLRQPMVLGHEVSGHIVAVGDGVTALAAGQLVAISPSRPCARCHYCLNGQPNHCENMRFYGSAMPYPHIQGAFSQQLIVDASQCVPANGLSPEVAAMAEPLAVCLHAVRQAGDLVGKTVLVTGCGPIGALTILAARRAGAAKIVVTDLSDYTLSIAKKCGADIVLNLASDSGSLSSFTLGKGQIDVQFECSGAPAALASGIAALRPKGTLVQVGIGGHMTIPMQTVTAKELTLRGSFRFHSEFAIAVEMMQKGLIDVTPLMTHKFSLDNAVDAFKMAKNRSQAMKVQIDLS